MNNIQLLIQRFLEGTLSVEERTTLKKWVEKEPENLAAFKEAVRKYDQMGQEVYDSQQAFETFMERISVSKSPRSRVYSLRWYQAAAVFIGLLFGVYLFKAYDDSKPSRATDAEEMVTIEKEPSKNVTLELANGTTKTLTTNEKTVFTDQKGQIYASQNGNTLRFSGKEMNHNGTPEEHMVSVPFGKTFKIALSDSTVVWLNSGSRLRFPEWFDEAASSRTVFLEGEAYFDVKRNEELPFLVYTTDVQVQVLGTAFNVSSYASDPQVTTTLVEGSVALHHIKSAEQVTIRPDTQATFAKNGTTFDTTKVDTSLFTAWMQDKLVFKDVSFEQILQRLERFYDVRTINNTKLLDQETFRGEFKKEDSLENVFEVLSASTGVKYRINGKTITLEN